MGGGTKMDSSGRSWQVMTGGDQVGWVVLVFSSLMLCAPTGPARAQTTLSVADLDRYAEKRPTGVIDWSEGYAEVAVVGEYNTARWGSSHAKIRAIEDAENKSSDVLYRLLRGLNVSADTRLAGDEKMEGALREAIKAERSMDIGKIENVTLQATFRLPLYGRKGLAHRVFDVLYAGQVRPGPLVGTSGGGYTSVVFDASGTELQPALFPRVLDEAGETLYGPGDLGAEALKRGASPARYLTRGAAGLSKELVRSMGDKPLVLTPDRIGGEFLADLILSPGEVTRLREAGVGDLLATGRVFIVEAKPAETTAAR